MVFSSSTSETFPVFLCLVFLINRRTVCTHVLSVCAQFLLLVFLPHLNCRYCSVRQGAFETRVAAFALFLLVHVTSHTVLPVRTGVFKLAERRSDENISKKHERLASEAVSHVLFCHTVESMHTPHPGTRNDETQVGISLNPVMRNIFALSAHPPARHSACT